MALKKSPMDKQVGDCLKSPIRVSGAHFRINVLMPAGDAAQAAGADSARLIISVPKRWVKRAIDRNTIKRLGRTWWSEFIGQDLPAVPRMAFVQISPKMLENCRDKRQGILGHGAWKTELALELKLLGERLQSRCARQAPSC